MDNEEKLHKIFANVNDWLRFAEAKNAALLALSGAATISMINLDAAKLSCYMYQYITKMSLPLFCIAVMIFLSSFIAHTKPFFVSKKVGKLSSNDNLLFYGDIANYSAPEYLTALYQKWNLQESDRRVSSEEEYAQQIVYNAKITVTKYKLFNTGLLVLLSGILTPVIAIPLYWAYKSNR